jgi:putative hydrolase of the HAD superfamily
MEVMIGNVAIKIELINIDFEGTTVNLEKAHHGGHLAAAADFGLDLTFEEAFRKIPAWIGGPDDAIAKVAVKLIKEKTGKDISPGDFVRRSKKHYLEILPEIPIKLRPGVRRAINWFMRNGFKIAVGSVTDTLQARPILKESGLFELVGEENFILREDVSKPKPDSEVWKKAAQRHNASPRSSLVIDDSPVGLQAAHEFGCPVIVMPVYTDPRVIARLNEVGFTRMFYDWREINWRALINNLNREINIKHF